MLPARRAGCGIERVQRVRRFNVEIGDMLVRGIVFGSGVAVGPETLLCRDGAAVERGSSEFMRWPIAASVP